MLQGLSLMAVEAGNPQPLQVIRVRAMGEDGKTKDFTVTCRIDTEIEIATKLDEGTFAGGPVAEDEKAAGRESDPGLLEKALARRPEPRAMDLRVKAGEAGVAVARSAWYPQVYLAGNYYDLRPNPRLLPAKDKFYSTWDVSLNVSMDLWNWGATARQTDQARARLAQARDALGMVKDAVALELRQCRLDLAAARAKIGVAREAVTQAEENLRVARERFREGVALNTDGLDAEVLALQSRTSLIQALVDNELAGARFRKALGE